MMGLVNFTYLIEHCRLVYIDKALKSLMVLGNDGTDSFIHVMKY